MLRQNRKLSSDVDDLKKACEVYKAYLEGLIREKLTPKLAGNGLSKVTIAGKDAQEFGRIRSRFAPGANHQPSALTSDEIEFIANRVIKKDPSPEFQDAHRDLYVLVQKYHAVNALTKVSDFSQFRKTYIRNFKDLTKESSDLDTQHFLHTVAKKLGVYAPNLTFFSDTRAGAVNDQHAVDDKAKLYRR